MKERLIIKNFGPIKEADLTFGRFNVLIGEQATGKSTVAKLLCICRYFSYLLPGNFINGLSDWNLLEGASYYEEVASISYGCRHYHFSAESTFNEEEGLTFKTDLRPISEEFETLLNELRKLQPEVGISTDNISWVPTTFFQKEVASILDNPFYFPVERGLQSVFSLGKSSIRNISDSLFNQFAKLDQIARKLEDVTIEPLGIEYHNERGSGWVIKNGRVTPVESAASGYQSTIPVVLGMVYYTELRDKKKTFIIEEPELNLFPTAQYELMKFLVDKTMNYGNTMLIATHSPYVLSALNNLMNAFQSGGTDKQATEAIIPERYWLNPAEVSAYLLKPDGTCEDIIDYEEGMIKSGKIDEVSGILNKSFNELLNIQFGITDAEP